MIQDTLPHWLEVIQQFDLGRFYSAAGPFIDFMLIFATLQGLIHFGLRRWTHERSMRVAGTALGAFIAISLSLFMKTKNVMLADLGPYSASFILVLLGLVIVQIFKGWRLTTKKSILSATVVGIVIALYLKQPSVAGMAVVLFLILLAVWPRYYNPPPYASFDWIPSTNPEDDKSDDSSSEVAFCHAQSSLQPIVKQARKDTAQILIELQTIIHTLERFGKQEKVRRLVATKLKHIQPKQYYLRIRLNELRQAVWGMENLAGHTYTFLSQHYNQLPPALQVQVDLRLQELKHRLNLEDQLNTLTAKIDQHETILEKNLKTIQSTSTQNNPSQTIVSLRKLIEHETGALDLIQTIDRLIAALAKSAQQAVIEMTV